MKRLFVSAPVFLLASVVSLSSALSAKAGAQVADHPRVVEALHLLDVWVDAQQAYGGIPGASLGVVHDQELLFAKGFGYAHVEEQVPATSSTMYSICSISKLFTSIGVMQQRDEGHLRVDDPVGKHLDWFDIEDTYPEAGPVTIEGVLTHSSGLPREADYCYWTGPDYPFPTHEEIVARIADQEMLYPARTYYQYSNLGLTLAGEILMQKSGMSHDDYVRTHILDPLGMENTTTEHLDELRGRQLATGYSARRRDGSRHVIPPYQVRGIAPAAGMLSTVDDLSKFASWQFRALEGDDGGILDRNTLREMQRVHFMEPDQSSTYGLGFSVWRDNDKTFVGHGGSCPGYLSHLLIRPQDKIATTFMTNGQGINTRGFTQRAYDIVAPAVRAALKDPHGEYERHAQLDRLTGTYERPLGNESAVLVWDGELVVVGLPTQNPLDSMTRLRRVDGDSFRRIREDGNLGEEFLFEEDADGNMRMWRNNNYSVRRGGRG